MVSAPKSQPRSLCFKSLARSEQIGHVLFHAIAPVCYQRIGMGVSQGVVTLQLDRSGKPTSCPLYVGDSTGIENQQSYIPIGLCVNPCHKRPENHVCYTLNILKTAVSNFGTEGNCIDGGVLIWLAHSE